MKPKSVTKTLMACLALMVATPAFAAPPDVENYCFVQSELVRPALTQPEKEAFIASCIADNTPTLPARKPRY